MSWDNKISIIACRLEILEEMEQKIVKIKQILKSYEDIR